MTAATYREVFQSATGNIPYAYQCRLACGPGATPEDDSTLQSGAECRSQLINIPTGLGKTAAVILAWLWNRVLQPDEEAKKGWPTRFVFCLPMRTLVEQTEKNTRDWLAKLGLADKVGVHVLMGGADSGEWDIYPEREAILIGTQDMLLSRALNRGYGTSRYRWPMHFGLLNNDCLWVIDETQLVGVGIETSAQLDGFRHDGKMTTFGTCATWWMSATLDKARLATVDHPQPAEGWPVEKLKDTEETSGRPAELIHAPKKLDAAPIVLDSVTKGTYAKQMAAIIKDRHHTGTLTLVVINRVARAREIFQAFTVGKKPLVEPAKAALIHSRFRRPDRERHMRLLLGNGDRIVIATQAVEAGVDVSARLLITELAPWSSLVQRIGRCNRRADIPDAEVCWVDIQPKDDKDDLVRPYSKTELDKSRTALATTTEASPVALGKIQVDEEPVIRPVIRRRDLVDLFDTTPDICGQDIDVSRYIRDGDDNDVQFFWRAIEGNAPTKDEPTPHRDELCRVSVGDAAKFLGKKPRAWRWDPLAGKWEEARAARPGVVYLVDVKSGGYCDTVGWTGDPKDKPQPHPPEDDPPTAFDDNRLTFQREWQTIAGHTQLVVQKMDTLCTQLLIEAEFSTTLHTAALWHDVGKAHEEFQKMLRNGETVKEGELLAKSPNRDGRCNRHGFRHELASALAWLLAETHSAPDESDPLYHNLVAYLIAAHHGKVRLSIRSMPDETGNLDEPEALFARGIWQDDELPPVPLGELTTPVIKLDLSLMQMGEGQHGPSWLARAITLRDGLGPFRLAYLETLLRAADARASNEQPRALGH